ncbi:MAG: hypothetical protein ACYDA8_01625 [Deferrisomatales bacterium]
MAKDAKAAQKAAQKRRQREKRVKEASARRREGQGGAGSRRTLESARDLPIEECVISKGWQERGLAHLLVARARPDGSLLVGGYYVDTWCLGLKDSMAVPSVAADEYQRNVKPNLFKDEVEFEPCDPGVARAIVEGAITWGARWGFHPNRRWDDSRRVLEGVEARPEGLVFGVDGRPCLVMRPGENLQGARLRLERKAGTDGFTVVEGEPGG